MRTVVGIHSGPKTKVVMSHPNDPVPSVWFDSLRQLTGVLSDENRALLRLIQEQQPRTVMELAALSGRAASNLSRTLRTLEDHGLVRLHRSSHTRAVRPEALATEFLVVLDSPAGRQK
jgi:predicted transcriptional regulator